MGSTRSTRNTLRATAGGEIAVTSVGSYFPAAAIPIKFTQTLGAFGMFLYQKDCTAKDRALLLFQSLLAATQLTLASILYFTNRTCDTNSNEPICVASFYLMLVYHGTLLTGWGMSELIRQPFATGAEGSQTTTSGEGSTESEHSVIHIPHPPVAPRQPGHENRGRFFGQNETPIPSVHLDRALSPSPSSEALQDRRPSAEPFEMRLD